jgi:hypothetical protein
MKTTQVRLDIETAKRLREIAAQFGFYTERGLGAGEIGNTAAMLAAVARGDFQIRKSDIDSQNDSQGQEKAPDADASKAS